MARVLNRWNRKWYTLMSATKGEVTLEREDKSQFTIEKKELFANYANIQGNEEVEKILKNY